MLLESQNRRRTAHFIASCGRALSHEPPTRPPPPLRPLHENPRCALHHDMNQCYIRPMYKWDWSTLVVVFTHSDSLNVIQSFIKQIACNAAQNKRLFSAALSHCIFCYYQVLHFSNLAALHAQHIFNTCYRGDNKHCYQVANHR